MLSCADSHQLCAHSQSHSHSHPVPTNFELHGVELLLLEVVPQHVPVALLLLRCKLPEGEALDQAVARWHAQGAATLCGHAGEALSPVKVVHRHTLKVYVAAAAHPLSGPLLQVSCGEERGGVARGRVNNGRVGKSALGESWLCSHSMLRQFQLHYLSAFVFKKKNWLTCTVQVDLITSFTQNDFSSFVCLVIQNLMLSCCFFF